MRRLEPEPREALGTADQHYNRLIQKAYEVIDASDAQDNLGEKSKAIKLILDIETKRIEMLQKAGLLENKEIAEELMEMERKQAVLVAILREVSGKVSALPVKLRLARRLADAAPVEEVYTVNVP